MKIERVVGFAEVSFYIDLGNHYVWLEDRVKIKGETETGIFFLMLWERIFLQMSIIRKSIWSWTRSVYSFE